MKRTMCITTVGVGVALSGLLLISPLSLLAQESSQGQVEHKGMHGADNRCDCCEMMKQMMQMMRTMHQHSGERGMKMDMMQSPGPAPQGSAPQSAAEHQHEDKPRN